MCQNLVAGINVLFAHLRETNSADLPFIDKALAVFEAKVCWSKELAVDSLSQRQLEELFKERGLGLSHSMISKMGYAVDVLWPLMPKALAAGLGRPRWRGSCPAARPPEQSGSDENWETIPTSKGVFAALCRRHDGASGISSHCTMHWSAKSRWNPEQNRQVIHLEMGALPGGRPSTPDTTLDDLGLMGQWESRVVGATDSEQIPGRDYPAQVPAEEKSTALRRTVPVSSGCRRPGIGSQGSRLRHWPLPMG